MFVKGQSNCDNFYWFWLRYCKQEHWAYAKEKLNKSIFNIITGGANYRVARPKPPWYGCRWCCYEQQIGHCFQFNRVVTALTIQALVLKVHVLINNALFALFYTDWPTVRTYSWRSVVRTNTQKRLTCRLTPSLWSCYGCPPLKTKICQSSTECSTTSCSSQQLWNLCF